MNAIIYDSQGVILRTVSCPEEQLAIQGRPEENAIPGAADGSMHYVDVETKTLRDKFEITAVLSGATLAGLPSTCTLVIEQARYIVGDGVAELAFDLPGVYVVKVEALHYLSKTFEVTV
jgi:hypothetical protein